MRRTMHGAVHRVNVVRGPALMQTPKPQTTGTTTRTTCVMSPVVGKSMTKLV